MEARRLRVLRAHRRARRDGRGDRARLPQREIADAAFRYQREVDLGQRIVVGVNDFRTDEDELTEIHRPDPAAEARQRERLERTRAARDAAAVEGRSPSSSGPRRRAGENLMPAILGRDPRSGDRGEMVALAAAGVRHLQRGAAVLRHAVMRTLAA